MARDPLDSVPWPYCGNYLNHKDTRRTWEKKETTLERQEPKNRNAGGYTTKKEQNGVK